MKEKLFDFKLTRRALYIWLLFIFGIGLFLRTINLSFTTFTYDQARDAIEALDIVRGDHLKILGPMTDIRGLFHGPLFWYITAPFYYFSNENVLVVKMFLILVNLLGMPIIYLLAKDMFKNKTVGILSAFFYAISFEAIQYGRWLSNPAPALVTSLLVLCSFWLMINGNVKGIFLFLVVWPMSVHFQFFFVYQLLPFVVILLIYRPKIDDLKKNIAYLLGSLAISALLFSTFIMAELKFGFQGINGLTSTLSQDGGLFKSFTEVLLVFVDKMTWLYRFTFSGINLTLSGILFLGSILTIVYISIYRDFFRKQVLLLIAWLFVPIVLLSFDKLGAYFITLGSITAAIILTSFLIVYFMGRTKHKYRLLALIVVFVVLGNSKLVLAYKNDGEPLFGIQKKMLLSDQFKVIDWIYSENKNKKFAIDTVTNPLFINTTWAFQFDSYGRKNYGFMPTWSGYPQVEVYGSKVEFSKNEIEKGMELYVIYEPKDGIPDEYYSAYPVYENTRSTMIKSKNIGNFIIEKRIFTENIGFSRDELFEFAIHARSTKP